MIDPEDLEFCKERSDHSNGFEYLYERIYEKSNELPFECPFLEIGTRAGGSALLFLEAMKGLDNKLFITIDPYGKNYKSGGDWPLIGEETYRKAMSEIFTRAYGYHITHVHYRMTSAAFMSLNLLESLWMNNKCIEMPYGVVYLDGEHVDSVVCQEIDYFILRMHRDGLIIIDDVSYLKDTSIEYLKDILKLGHEDNNRLFLESSDL